MKDIQGQELIVNQKVATVVGDSLAICTVIGFIPNKVKIMHEINDDLKVYLKSPTQVCIVH